MQPDQYLQIIESVDHFYGNAWQHLLWILGSSIAVFAIILPILTFFYQFRLFKAEEDRLQAALANMVSGCENGFRDVITKNLKEESEKIERVLAEYKANADVRLQEFQAQMSKSTEKTIAELSRDLSRTSGSIYHVQMGVARERRSFESAFTSAVDALFHMEKALDWFNARRVMTVLNSDILPALDESNMTRRETVVNDLDQIIKRIRSRPEIGVSFEDLSRDIVAGLQSAKVRPSKKD